LYHHTALRGYHKHAIYHCTISLKVAGLLKM
jgi:hypothetical protein